MFKDFCVILTACVLHQIAEYALALFQFELIDFFVNSHCTYI